MALSRPRFRRDLIAVPIVVDGIAYVDVNDPRGGESFRFYDFEYKVALAFGGLPFERVVPWVRISAGLELTESQLSEFAEELGRRGFLEDREGPTPPPVDMPTTPRPVNATLSMGALSTPGPAPSVSAPVVVVPAPIPEPAAGVPEPAAEVPEPVPAAVVPVGDLVEPPTDVMGEPTPDSGRKSPEPPAPEPPVPEPPAPATPAPFSSSDGMPDLPPDPESVTMDMRLEAIVDDFAFEPTVASGKGAVASGEGVTPPTVSPEPHTPVADLAAVVSSPPLNAEAIPAPSSPSAPEAEPEPKAFPVVELKSETSPVSAPEPETPPVSEPEPEPETPPVSEESPASGSSASGLSLIEELSSVVSPVPPTMDVKEMDVAKRAAELAQLWEPVAESEGGESEPAQASPPAPAAAPEEGGVALPAWMSPIQAPPAIMTPAPVTFGPMLNAEAPSPLTVRRRRRSFLLFASMGILAGTLVFVLAWQLLAPERTVSLPKLSTIKVSLATLHRFYPTPVEVTRAPGKVFTLPATGKVSRLPPVGSKVSPGEVLAQTEKSKPLAAQLAHLRERLAYNTQLRDAMRAEGKAAEAEAQEPKIAERKAQIDKLLQSLSAMVPVADVAGEVEAVMLEEGAQVAAGAEVLRLKSAGYRAQFALSKPEAARARRERLCILWVGDRMIECRLVDGAETDTIVAADVPDGVAGPEILGKPARLLRALYRNACEVPARTVVHGETSTRVWLVSPRSRVEPRPVTVGEEDDESAILVQGVDDGDILVAEPSPALSAGSLIRYSPPEIYRPRAP